MEKPSLTFFCELDSDSLTGLFSGSKVIQYLQKLDANLSLGLLDLSPQRAEVVKKLNKAGIPVTAWILLPKEQGYWTSLDTILESEQRYMEFKDWVAKYKLVFAAVGLDIEPKLDTMSNLAKNPRPQIFILIKRLIADRSYKDYLDQARDLIQSIQWDGYPVETYQMPTVLDEKSANSIVLTKTLGIPPLPSDREVLMLYSSFFSNFSDSILWSYAQQCQAVGVGSTGGGVEIDGVPALKTLRWIDLKRDLLLSSQAVRHLYIFSLEGCVENNYMDRLLDLDWETQVIPPSRSARGISLIRKLGQGVLWGLSHPFETLLGIIVGVTLLETLRRWFARKE